MSYTIQELNIDITKMCIEQLITASSDFASESDVIRWIATIVECTGGTLDACSICGAMPMTTNCNNAGCDV